MAICLTVSALGSSGVPFTICHLLSVAGQVVLQKLRKLWNAYSLGGEVALRGIEQHKPDSSFQLLYRKRDWMWRSIRNLGMEDDHLIWPLSLGYKEVGWLVQGNLRKPIVLVSHEKKRKQVLSTAAQEQCEVYRREMKLVKPGKWQRHLLWSILNEETFHLWLGWLMWKSIPGTEGYWG